MIRDSIVDSIHEVGYFETRSDKNINEIESDVPVKTKDRNQTKVSKIKTDLKDNQITP